MRAILIVTGILFLVLSAILYFSPVHSAGVSTTTLPADGNENDVRTSYATFTMPIQVTLASFIIGILLTTLGFILPGVTHKDYSAVEITHIERNGNGRKRRHTL